VGWGDLDLRLAPHQNGLAMGSEGRSSNRPSCCPQSPRLARWQRSPACSRKIASGAGWSVGQATWRLGVSPAEYRRLEDGATWPNWKTFERICKLYGWPQTFVGATGKPLPL
jgi:hypothetical protein